jgi:phospholipase C
MYSLTGDVQYDRFGVPILDNNHGDNFLLSRAATIYDLLTRRGVSWRVYESEPSVTMLRMFARYATNTTDIVPIARLEADAAGGNLPQFTVVEPAMHHHPQDDDHPDADMYRGQIFAKRVYDALRANPALWRKTLLLITYDEHGGLYDHVVPPIADVLSPGPPRQDRRQAGRQRSSARAQAALRRRHRSGWWHRDRAGSGHRRGGTGSRPRRGGTGSRRRRDRPAGAAAGADHHSYGVRVPTFVVSPWVKPGKGPRLTLDHCSILKTVLARFGGGSQPFLSDRVHASHSFDAFLAEAEPRLNVPPPDAPGTLPIDVRRVTPGASQIITPPLSRKRMREGPVDYHDLSGRLARMLGR